jgi:hypothetical protein
MKIANAKVITKSLIDWLDIKYRDKTITTEIAVNTTYGTKIADVVISNGHAIAYEIKSELDTTKRLDSQIRGFSEIFEYVYLVYWSDKFTLDTLNLPENTGAIKAYWKNEKIHFELIKKAKINHFATPLIIAKLLWKNELIYFLTKKNIEIKTNYDKSTLVKLFTENFNKRESVKVLRFIFRNRFERGYLAYTKIKHKTTALHAFKKFKIDKDYLTKLSA